MSVNEEVIYNAALARWGHDRQLLKTIERCGALAGALCRFLSQGQNMRQVCQTVADMEIMLAQLRLNGLAAMIDDEKVRKLDALSQRLLTHPPATINTGEDKS
ncbi:hypothetical protein ACWWJF_12700 [Symbiopectobacterium sp. Eva_TO]